MPQKRNKFLTVVFSFLPGAGHMFMGFMKTGLSLMIAFFLVVFLSSLLNLGPLVYIVPILIAYSFFDCINRDFASDEEFSHFTDHYLFTRGNIDGLDTLFKGKGRLILGIVILIIGVDLLWKFVSDVLSRYVPPEIYSSVLRAGREVPQFVFGALIIALGVYLVIGRKRSDKNA